MNIRVIVADDQAIARQRLRMILESAPDIEVIGEALGGLDAVGQAERRRPDVVLMQIRMPRMDELEANRRLRELEGVHVIVITTFDLDEYVFEALRAGAVGFLVKDSPPEQDHRRRLRRRFSCAAPPRGRAAPADRHRPGSRW